MKRREDNMFIDIALKAVVIQLVWAACVVACSKIVSGIVRTREESRHE